MKKFCLSVIVLFMTACVVHAYIESSEMTSERFLRNEGYSSEVYRLIHLKTQPDQAFQERLDKKNKNKVWHYAKKVYSYLDPYMDSGEFGCDNTKFYPSWDEI